MHPIIILAALGLAWAIRLVGAGLKPTTNRFAHTLVLFLLPPLLLITTSLAMLCMGPQGSMLGLEAGWFSYLLAVGFLGLVGINGLKLGWQGWRSLVQTRTYPLITLGDRQVRAINTLIPFAAQVGFWQPELVVSQGLLQVLDRDRLDAVITHEQAHYHYRDTFWFFWLGWVRTCTAWLPSTENLWQELLLMRELRADRWAAQRVDPLLLAESLLVVVSAPLLPESCCATFSAVVPPSRLEERVAALLAPPDPVQPEVMWWSWTWFLLVLLPLIAVPFHT